MSPAWSDLRHIVLRKRRNWIGVFLVSGRDADRARRAHFDFAVAAQFAAIGTAAAGILASGDKRMRRRGRRFGDVPVALAPGPFARPRAGDSRWIPRSLERFQQ